MLIHSDIAVLIFSISDFVPAVEDNVFDAGNSSAYRVRIKARIWASDFGKPELEDRNTGRKWAGLDRALCSCYRLGQQHGLGGK